LANSRQSLDPTVQQAVSVLAGIASSQEYDKSVTGALADSMVFASATEEGIKRGREEAINLFNQRRKEENALLAKLKREEITLEEYYKQTSEIDKIYDALLNTDVSHEDEDDEEELEKGGVQKHKRMRFDEGEEKKEKEDDE
jgi:hypothetical protein